MTAASEDINKSKRGRPHANTTGVMVRVPPDDLASLDAWIAARGDNLSRPEAIRQLMRAALDQNG